MRLVTYSQVLAGASNGSRVGALLSPGDQVVDLSRAHTSMMLQDGAREATARAISSALIPEDMASFVSRGPKAWEAAETALSYVASLQREAPDSPAVDSPVVHRRTDVRLLAPIQPPQFRDTLSFEAHLKNAYGNLGLEIPRQWYQIPTVYRTSGLNIAGPEDDIIWPSYTERLDYELELACVVGGELLNAEPDEAEAAIFGYTIYNDVSARDIQGDEMSLMVGPAKSKSFLNSNVIGPCIVTADEVNAADLNMYARCNGELWTSANSGDMFYSFAEIMSYLSMEERLYPAELIGSGTVGNGSGIEHGRWLSPGDTIELEVTGIGVLRNRVVRDTEARPIRWRRSLRGEAPQLSEQRGDGNDR